MSSFDASTLRCHFADSEVAAIETSARMLRICFSAAATSAQPPDGGAPLQGYSRGLALWLDDAQVRIDGGPAFGRLANGRLDTAYVAGTAGSGVPVGLRLDGPVRLELAFANGTRLQARGASARLAFDGPPNLHESLMC